MRILCMLPAARGVYPPEAAERRLALMRSYTTPATQIDTDYMPAVSGFSPWGGSGDAEPPPDAAARAAHLSAQRAVQAAQEGYDAFCPFGIVKLLGMIVSPGNSRHFPDAISTDPTLRQPALYLLFRPNSRSGFSSLRGTPTRTADAVAVGSVGQWDHTSTKSAGHARGI